MTQKRLSALCGGLGIVKRYGDIDPEITGLSYDSRNVKPGHLFFALIGAAVNGHSFIPDAEKNGAAAIIHSQPVSHPRPNIVYLQVEHTRSTVAPVAASFFDNPSQELFVIGVTGTDGKSSTVSMIHQLLQQLGYNSGFFSTVQYQYGDKMVENRFKNTTPEAVEIQHILRQMVGHGKRFAVIEASSHGLSKKNNRLGNIDFDCAVLTNISHEHLEFHGSYEQYRRDKANLFRFLDQHRSKTNTAFGVVNLDDPNVAFFRNVTNSPVYTFSTKDPSADIYADMVSMIGPKNDGPTDSGPKWANIDSMGRGPKHVSVNPEEQSSKFANGDSTDQGSKPATRQSYTQESGTHLELRFAGRRHRTVLPIPGVYNIDNMLAAVLSVHYATGISMERICNSIPGLKPIPGRMTNISAGQPFSVTVDFAHTPGAFSRLLPAAKRQTEGKLIVLFGSAGDRDKAKRRMQGSVADEHADIIVLTDEDPRSEDPIAIMEEIASACSSHIRGSSLFLIPDRKEAIRKALSVAGPGDSVLLLGKGHENSIIYASESRPWDEVAAAQEALERMGYGSHVTS